MSNNYIPKRHHKLGYVWKISPGQKHCCDYWWGNGGNGRLLFEVVNNYPVKHWWQDVVKEIVEYEG